MIDQVRPQVAFLGAGCAGIGGQDPSGIALRYRRRDPVQRQGTELVDHLGRDLLGLRRNAGQQAQGKGADQHHGASIERPTQMKTKQAIGDWFGDRLVKLIRQGAMPPKDRKRMMIVIMHRLTTSAAMLALIAGIGTGATAQTPAANDLPAPLAGLNLTNLDIESKRDGMRDIEGRTADGVDIEAKVDMAGNLVEVEADDGALPQSLIDAMVSADLRGQPVMAQVGPITEINQHPDHVEIKGRQPSGAEIEVRFDRQNALIGIDMDDAAIPADLVNTLLPQAVRDNEVIGQFDRIDEIGNRNGRIMVQGEDATGQDMRAEFDADGRVLRFGREDGPRGDRREERRGGRGPGHDDRGPGGHEMRGDMTDHGPDADDPRGNRSMGDGPRGAAAVPADFDAVAVNQRLSEAGYTGFGFLRAAGAGLMLEATNPQGEAVTLELDRQGEVVRETAR